MKRIILFFTILLLISCNSKKEKIEISETVKYNIKPLTYSLLTINQVESLIDSVKIINLEGDKNALIFSVFKMLVLNNGDFILTDKNNILHFSNTGKFIRNYGNKGRGPSEYIALEDISVDEQSLTLFAIDAMNKVILYDIKTGDFKKSLILKWKNDIKRMDFIIPAANESFYILSSNVEPREVGNEYYCLIAFNSNGEEIGEYLPTTDFVYMNTLVTQSYNNRCLIKPIDNRNIVYEVANGEISSLCHVDFGDLNIPGGEAFTEDGSMYFPQLISNKYYKIPQYFQDTKDYISFLVAGPFGESYSYLYSKNTENGISLAAPNKMTFPIKFLGSDEDFLYMIMGNYSWEGVEEHADPLSYYIMEKYGVLAEDDNLRIIGIKFKF